MQADLFRVASSFFRVGLFLPSITNLSCNFSRCALTVWVFALHPDSLMMRVHVSSWVKSKHCPVGAFPTLTRRFRTRRRLASVFVYQTQSRHRALPSSPLCFRCGPLLHCVCLLGIIPVLHRSGSHSQFATCDKYLKFGASS